MTIQYSDQFFKLLLRWKGSLWKTIWKDLLVFLLIYYTINATYRFALSKVQQEWFETVVILLNDYISQLPLTFLLGFYVGMVVQRWWSQFNLLSWPDQFLYCVSAHVKGLDQEARVIRRSIARYCMLSAVLAWRSVSIRVLRRFPSDEHLIEYGLVTEAECQLLKSVHVHFDPHKLWFLPLNWIQTILVKCLEQKRLSHTVELKFLLDELYRYRQGFANLFLYQWVNIPLVYTQVATIAVYGYFGLCLIGRQYPFSNEKGRVVDMYFPVVTVLQFLFYVGWLKVGEDLIQPLGADDEDFELNYLIDRNLEMAFLIVDDLHMQMPRLYTTSLEEDPDILPHTKASMKVRGYAPKQKLCPSVFTADEMKIVIPPEIEAITEKYASTAELAAQTPQMTLLIDELEAGYSDPPHDLVEEQRVRRGKTLRRCWPLDTLMPDNSVASTPPPPPPTTSNNGDLLPDIGADPVVGAQLQQQQQPQSQQQRQQQRQKLSQPLPPRPHIPRSPRRGRQRISSSEMGVVEAFLAEPNSDRTAPRFSLHDEQQHRLPPSGGGSGGLLCRQLPV